MLFFLFFLQGELGFRLDEKPGISVVSVVTEVSDKGQAQQKGLKMGCILVGINRDPYLSHAHAVSTLKHSKRPVTVRFKHRNYS
jgi:predicted metalloprotease with PDZ domain